MTDEVPLTRLLAPALPPDCPPRAKLVERILRHVQAGLREGPHTPRDAA